MPKQNKNFAKKPHPVAVRGRPAVHGKGSYAGDIWNKARKYIPRALGGAGALLLGKDPRVGWEAGAEVSKNVLGWGKYRAPLRGHGSYGLPWNVSDNSLTSEGGLPAVTNLADKGVRISHTEFLGVVTSTTTFANTVYGVNPGLATTFPWLSKLAVNFQQWQIHGCLVTFVSQMTDAVATFSALGSVAIAANMNPAERPCGNQMEMEQLKFCAVSKPSNNIVAPVECARYSASNNSYFVRNGPVPESASLMDYDHGTIQVAVNACPAAGIVLGRLYIAYDISLLNPRMVMGGAGTACYRISAVNDTNPFGGSPSYSDKITDTVGLTFPGDVSGYNNTVAFPRGTYGTFLVHYNAMGASTECKALFTTTFDHCALSSTFTPFGIHSTPAPVHMNPTALGVITADYELEFVLEISDVTEQASFKLAGTVPGTSVGGDLMIVALPISPGLAPVSVSSPCRKFIERKQLYNDPPQPSAPSAAGGLVSCQRDPDDPEDPEGPESFRDTRTGAAAGAASAGSVSALRKAFQRS